ncbi:fatty acid-binding protein-like [Euwallacea fornicatus]|uniref:fatty acid-binding protein-like n=1 Tax=Euwallacea fornicatus TaxID=995702 RepID=UPI00338DA98C
MSKITGKYTHAESEGLDEYFKALGVPYIPRKMMCASNPTIEISKTDDDQWTISTSTTFRTSTYTFKLGEPYEETMPGNTLKCTTTIEEEKLITICEGRDDLHITRVYVFSEEGMTLTYLDKKSQKEAIRHFKRSS